MAQNTRRPCLDQSLQDSRASGMLGKRSYFSMFDWGPISELHQYGKKRGRMSNEQVRVLEKSFEEVGDGKLEAEKKKKLAQELGLQPRQVVVWFQNRRARWKKQQLHLHNDHLKQASDAVMADNHKLRAQVAELKAELEGCKNNNGKDIVLKSVKSESETEVEANESNQTGIKMSRTLGKYNLSKKCSKVGSDACGGGIDIDIDINMDMDGDNFSSVQDVSSMNLMKYHGDGEESYCSFLTDPDLYYSDSYSCCSLWD